MVVELFTSKTFEEALGHLGSYVSLGIVGGEFSYKIPLDGQSGLMIRSSVKENDLSAGSSQDSIRIWLVDNKNKLLAMNTFKWVTRQPGWQDRLNNRILEISNARALAGDCQGCKKPKGIYKTKQGKNEGKMFTKCFPCDAGFIWFDQLKLENVWFSEDSHGKVGTSDNSNQSNKRQDISFDKPQSDRQAVHTVENNSLQPLVSNASSENKRTLPDKEISDMPKVPGGNDSGGLAAFLAEADKPESQPVQLVPVVWSDYQNDIYDFVQAGKGHGVVSGVAGCGKTATNVHILSLLDPNLKTKYAAFNKHIEIDISKKAPGHVDVSTLHKWGKNNIEAAWPKCEFKKYKVYDIIDKYKFTAKDDFPLKQSIAKLVGLLKGSLIEPTDKNIQRLADDFCVDIEPEYIGFARRTFNVSVADMSKFDLDDMIYFPAIYASICQTFDYIAIDEYQDLNWAQSKLTTNSLAPDGRILGVGDPNQSMYQFRGAGIGIMDRMASTLNATRLPLSISYRAPLAIVDLVNDKYPHIDFEAAPNAISGNTERIDYGKFYDIVNDSHGVLCRTNAPLVPHCFALIRRGIKATILGRDIGKNLLGLINKRAKLKRTKTLDNLLSEIAIYQDNQIAIYERDKMVSRAALLDDQCKTIYALAAECWTINDLKQKCKSIFSADRQGVTFSTIHKAKGLEWDTVHILEPQLIPHPMAKSSRDRAQEVNIMYVADTRTKNKLYYVQGD